MRCLAEALVIALGLLILSIRFAFLGLFTAVLPMVSLLAAAIVSGAMRTVVLLTVFPLVVVAWCAVNLADVVGDAVPAPRWPRPLEVA